MKKFLIVLFVSIAILSIVLCFLKPKMHKPFSFNIIEYVIKFNADGQRETIKKITTTTLEQKK